MAAASLWVASPSHSLLRPRRPACLPPPARCASAQLSPGEPSSSSSSMAAFLRFQTGEARDAGELQTSIVRYRKKFPSSLFHPFLEVDLVSAIHLADKEYFDILKTVLDSYDCVLYEMVASQESLENRRNRIAAKTKASPSKNFSIIGFIQRQMARALSLDFQLDSLDYDKEKWCHADLDYETFKSLQIEKGETFFTFARDVTLRSAKPLLDLSLPKKLDSWRSKLLWVSRVLPMPLFGILIIGSVCAPPEDQVTRYPEVEALSKLDLGAAMKIFLAKRLTSEFAQIAMDDSGSSVIIGERNKVAMDALRAAIGSRKNRIAVLYGSGHMPDLDRRLQEDLDMVPTDVQWITAWSIRSRELDRDSLPFLKTLAQMSGWPLNRYQTLALLIFSSVLALDLCFWELFVGAMVNWASWFTTEVGMHAYKLQM